MPLVSVVMSIYNDGHYVSQAVESILAQSFRDFEFLIVDDGCTDNTREVLSRYRDDRIRLIVNEKNLGLAPSLNKAIRHSCAKYIARQDADDISLPDRLEREIACLETQPDICIVGSSAIIISDSSVPKGHWSVPSEDVDLKWQLLFRNPFIHSSVMLRRSILERAGYYPDDPQIFRAFVEDYDLWSRMNRIDRSTNFSTPLLKFRRHPTSASVRTHEQQMYQMDVIAKQNVCWILGWDEMDPLVWRRLRLFLLTSPEAGVELSQADVREVLSFLQLLQHAFYKKYNFSKAEMSSHRSRSSWLWGKHAVALACRGIGRCSPGCRLRLLVSGAKLLSNTVTARWSDGVRKSGRV